LNYTYIYLPILVMESLCNICQNQSQINTVCTLFIHVARMRK
jgi:hypothetical protein